MQNNFRAAGNCGGALNTILNDNEHKEGINVIDKREVQTMLIADDRDGCLRLKNIFGGEFATLETNGGDEFFTLMTAHKVDIALVNMKLPRGREFMLRLKSDDHFLEIPVLALVNTTEEGARALDNGASDFLIRPFNDVIARHRVHTALDKFSADRRLAKVNLAQQSLAAPASDELDHLTGLCNREAFYKKSAALMHSDVERKYFIIYFDISCFKAINDLFHIETGNLILRTAAKYFKRQIDPTVGICGRMEADHFVVCVPQDRINIGSLLEGLDGVIRDLDISHNILFYAGVYPVNNIELPVDQMGDRANMALKKIKGNYMNRYAYYDDGMREVMLQDQMIVRDMEAALRENQFAIFLQPVYNVRTDSVDSAEALIRWFHPINGMISPGKFIPVFERNGFIVKTDRFVWESVCRFIKEQREQTGQVIPISVNVSRLNFYNLDLLEFLLGLLEKYDLESWMLKLEITESAYTDNQHQLMSIIRAFREEGFPVLMDDFGSGYSSLNMLKNLPVDVLKVDMAFVRELEESERAYMILKFIMMLARELGMDVIVEGVETKKQLDYLVSLGADKIQGYYFSRPLPIPDFKQLLEAKRLEHERR